MTPSGKKILVVDDEPGLADLAAEYLRRIDDEMSITTATSASEGLSYLGDDDEFDCVVSDYNMPEMNGLEFLEAVRDDYPSLPFILYTGKGSEEIASEAISAGVTDYLQKESGTDHYEVLANRIENAISENRAKVQLRRTGEKIEALHETAARAATCTHRTELCQLAVDAAEDILAFDICDISLCEGSHLVPAAVSKGVPSDGYYWSTPVDAEDNFAARAYRQGETIRIDDLRDHGVAPAESDYRSTLTVPIDDHGVFQAVSRDVEGFSDRDLELAELLLAHVSAALDRIQSEEQLRDERDKFAALFHNIPHAIGVGSFEDGEPVITEANPTFEEVFGWDIEDIAGRPIDDLIVPESDSAEDEAAEINERMRDGEHVSGWEVRRITADGPRDFLLHTVLAPEEDADGFVVYTDITEQKRRERELQRQNQHLDEFVSVLRHEVRDSLATADDIAGRLDAEDADRLDRLRTALDRIERRVDEAVELAERGRILSESATASIPAVVEEAWEAVETGEATLTTDDPPSEVSGDESRLGRLFETLFRNVLRSAASARASGDDSVESSPDAAVTVEVGALDGRDGLYVAVEGGRGGDTDDGLGCEGETGCSQADDGLRVVEDIARVHGWTVRTADGPSDDRPPDDAGADTCRVELCFPSADV
ncbi:response regulator [Halorussus caseinilyticus]|uniref:hybrid sensor histidine kinase/response regulator n=1 Tax=Halorussus caseinilyticus TaxID=3034025 RepID=UPI0023E7DCFD|nr:response regulator [Halorussus sp. DT72]